MAEQIRFRTPLISLRWALIAALAYIVLSDDTTASVHLGFVAVLLASNVALPRLLERVGLGLSVSKRLVEFLGGVIRVRSEPGEGSTLVITLPVETASS